MWFYWCWISYEFRFSKSSDISFSSMRTFFSFHDYAFACCGFRVHLMRSMPFWSWPIIKVVETWVGTEILISKLPTLIHFTIIPFRTLTRAALMTGGYFGCREAYRSSSGRTMMPADERTIADVFSENGHTIGMIGKWHLWECAPHRPQDRGFQEVVWHRCGGVGQASDDWGNDYFDDACERNGSHEKFEGYCTDVWFGGFRKFIERNKEHPFFLYLPANAPHGHYRLSLQ